MKVEVKELRILLKYVESKIAKMETSSNASSAELFDLNIVDSNLTLLLSSLDENVLSYELNDRHPHIRKALLDYREKFSAEKKETVMESLAGSCRLLEEQLVKMEKAVSSDESEFFKKNIQSRIDVIRSLIQEISGIDSLSDRSKKSWFNKTVSINSKIAAKILGGVTSAAKAAAARQNGKKGGRPALKKESSRAGAKTASKTVSKSAKTKTSAARTSKTAAEKVSKTTKTAKVKTVKSKK